MEAHTLSQWTTREALLRFVVASLAFMIEAFSKYQCSLDSILTVKLNKADLKLYMNRWFLSVDGAPFGASECNLVFSLRNPYITQNPTVIFLLRIVSDLGEKSDAWDYKPCC